MPRPQERFPLVLIIMIVMSSGIFAQSSSLQPEQVTWLTMSESVYAQHPKDDCYECTHWEVSAEERTRILQLIAQFCENEILLFSDELNQDPDTPMDAKNYYFQLIPLVHQKRKKVYVFAFEKVAGRYFPEWKKEQVGRGEGIFSPVSFWLDFKKEKYKYLNTRSY